MRKILRLCGLLLERASSSTPLRRLPSGIVGLCAVALLVSGTVVGTARGAQLATPQTVVSLTFDDGDATQYVARSMLSSRAMHATFFINSPRVGGDSYYMTWPQINDLAADGNEIGGHTAYHANLVQVDPTEAQREVCYDRANLLNRGFSVTDFAYPYGAYNSSIEQVVKDCGYNSARTTNDFGSNCTQCAESIPPADPYATLITASVSAGLSSVESAVTRAEQHGGGWVQIVAHTVCSSGCSTTESDLSSLLDWLQQQAANGVVIKTVQQVVGGPVQPANPGPSLPPPPNGTNALTNPSLEQDADGDGVPDCWTPDTWGTQSTTWTRTTDAHSGTYAEKVTVRNYSSGDDKLIQTEDLGACAPSVTAGHQYRLTAWYKSSAPVSFVVFSRDTVWEWVYWTNGPVLPASSSWTLATWVTPVIPGNVNGLSFGIAIETNGSLTVDDLGIDDAAATSPADTTPPATTISCNGSACGGFYAQPASIALTATDGGSGVQKIVYTTDGTDPSTTNGTVYSAPFTVSSTTTIKYRAYDNAGNVEAVHSQLVGIDSVPPATTISCNGTTCSASWYTAAVSITLAAADTGGSGLSKIVYTTNGTDPSPTNGTTYAGSFSVSSTATVKYRAFDNAGNAESIRTQLIQVDVTSPSTTIRCNSSTCLTGWYKAPVTVTLSAVDAGSGVAKIVYTTDGTDPSATNGTASAGTSAVFSVSSTATLKYRAYDNVGNAEAIHSQVIRIDTVAPSVAITSPTGGTVSRRVTIAATASDSGGSGVAQVTFYYDGNPIGTDTSAPYSVTWNTNKVPLGQHTLTAVAQDQGGNATTSAGVVVTVG